VEEGEALIVDLDGYEGPLHVLLALARNQKVDLLELSITALAEPVPRLRQPGAAARFSLAADYLVMAAWLAYLKSRLLLPQPAKSGRAGAGGDGGALAFRWPSWTPCAGRRRRWGRRVARPRRLPRGSPERQIISASKLARGDLYELVQAYVAQRGRSIQRHYQPAPPQAYPLEQARLRLQRKLEALKAWTRAGGAVARATARRCRWREPRLVPASTWRPAWSWSRRRARGPPGRSLRRSLSARPRPRAGGGMIDPADTERQLEALLFAAAEPLA